MLTFSDVLQGENAVEVLLVYYVLLLLMEHDALFIHEHLNLN